MASSLLRPGVVRPLSSWKCLVSWTTRPPRSSRSACRPISYRIARSTERSELTFFVSLRVPRIPEPAGESETLTSQRSEPCSIRTSLTPSERSSSRSSVTYARPTSGARAPVPKTGLVTISTSGMPARL